VPLIGCVLDDGDSDGPSYRLNWPGVFPNQAAERKRIPTPVEFTTPISDRKPLEFLSFEADLPRIEAGDEPANPVPPCDRATGAHCTNPPPGARFYPL